MKIQSGLSHSQRYHELTCSLRSKRFLACSSRKLGPEQKKKKGRGRGRGMKEPVLPSPSPFHLFFCSRSNFRSVTWLETLATQANSLVTLIPGTFLFSFLFCEKLKRNERPDGGQSSLASRGFHLPSSPYSPIQRTERETLETRLS